MTDYRLSKICDHYGVEHQQLKLVEESGELLTEIGRYLADGCTRTNVSDMIHEAADVCVLLLQLWPHLQPNGQSVREPEDAHEIARKLAETVALLASHSATSVRCPRVEQEHAETIFAHIQAFARILDAFPMLERTIEMKVQRQIERIAREKEKTAAAPIRVEQELD